MKIHVVRQKDSIYRIAARKNLSYHEIIRLNPHLKNRYRLEPGDEILLAEINDQKDSIIINGYAYPFLDPKILRESLPNLTFLSIFSYEVRPDGSLSSLDEAAYLELAREYEVSPRMVISNISEETGLFDAELAHTIMSDEDVTEIMIANMLQIMEEKHYEGADIDFENLYPDDKDLFNNLIIRLSNVLHENGYTLSAAIEKKTGPDVRIYEAHDYQVHGEYDDYVILMTYDWGYLFGPPMAISPLDQVEQVIEYAVTEIPSEKILMGIPNYAFDWTLPYVEGSKADPLSHTDALRRAIEYGAEVMYDETAQAPYYEYYDGDKQQHIVWFEDGRSIAAKLDLVKKYNLGGVSYWTVNKSFPQNWSIVKAMTEVKKL